jgi:Na+/H+-dicarboxylate symporter
MITSFTLSSSSAAMPVNIRTCTEKLGISPKVCNFSIPLGATINMDGTCISLVLAGLYLAKMYGVTITSSMIPTLLITIILLSLGCPGVPGAGLVCLGIVLTQIGVPVSAIGLIMAIDPLLDMFDTLSNTTEDVACALITASREGLLDREILNDMSRA